MLKVSPEFAALHCTDLQCSVAAVYYAMAIRVAKRGNVTARERGQLATSSPVLAALPATDL